MSTKQPALDSLLMPSERHLKPGLHYIADTDPDFARALTLISPLPSRQQPPGFSSLTKIIVEQQVSLASADAIWRRLQTAISPFAPEQLLTFSEEALRELGLSKQKAVYCRALAEDLTGRRLSLDRLESMEDEAISEALMQVKGIGRWTAEVYLIACLDRQDVWPAGDVALKIALQHLKGLDARPSVDEMDEHAAPLKPHRTLAARILWRYYADIVRRKK